MKRKESGFTWTELVIVLAIIVIIAAIAVPNLMRAIERGKEQRAAADRAATPIHFVIKAVSDEHNTTTIQAPDGRRDIVDGVWGSVNDELCGKMKPYNDFAVVPDAECNSYETRPNEVTIR